MTKSKFVVLAPGLSTAFPLFVEKTRWGAVIMKDIVTCDGTRVSNSVTSAEQFPEFGQDRLQFQGQINIAQIKLELLPTGREGD